MRANAIRAPTPITFFRLTDRHGPGNEARRPFRIELVFPHAVARRVSVSLASQSCAPRPPGNGSRLEHG